MKTNETELEKPIFAAGFTQSKVNGAQYIGEQLPGVIGTGRKTLIAASPAASEVVPNSEKSARANYRRSDRAEIFSIWALYRETYPSRRLLFLLLAAWLLY
jgi:hypothetical protein